METSPIKSKLWSENRDKIDSPVSAIDYERSTIPPIEDRRSISVCYGSNSGNQENNGKRPAPGVDPNRLVVEPYANPFYISSGQ